MLPLVLVIILYLIIGIIVGIKFECNMCGWFGANEPLFILGIIWPILVMVIGFYHLFK